MKDLIRFLKREDETCDIRRQLGHAQILQNDLIHVIKQYKEDTVLWETVIRSGPHLSICLSLQMYLDFQIEITVTHTVLKY